MKPSKFGLRAIHTLSLGIILLINVAALTGCGDQDNPAKMQAESRNFIKQAEVYNRNGQLRAAIIELRNALQKSPQDPTATVRLAQVFNELGQGKSALKLLEPLANNPDRDAALAIAQAYYLQHKYKSALDFLTPQIQRLGLANDAEANLLRARLFSGLGQLDAASDALARLDAMDPRAGLERARLALRRGDAAGYKAELETLLQQHPGNIDLLTEAASAAEQEGNLERAEDLLGKALLETRQTDLLLPQKAAVLQRLVSVLTKLGRSDEALIYAKTLADANPQGSLLQDKFKQGLAQLQAGKLDEAETILAEIYEESHNDTAGMLLGMIRYAKKDLRGAAEYLGSNVDPEVAPEAALKTLAAAQLELSQPEKVLAMFDAAAREQVKSPELKLLIGLALLQTGATDEGTRLIASAQAAQPDNPVIPATLARYYLSRRQADRAIAALESVLEVHPNDQLSRLLIVAQLQAKQPDAALATARALAKATPDNAENQWILGRTALYLQKPDIADAALREALTQKPGLLPAQLDLAQLHLLRRQYAQAEASYQSVLKQQPNNVAALKGLAITLAQQDIGAQALETRLLATANGNNARAVLAEYYMRQQRPDDAERLLAAVPDSETGGYPQQVKQRLLLSRAASAVQAQDLAKARALISTGLQRNPRNPELLALLARIDLQDKNLDSAKKIAAQLEEIQPQSLQSLELQGDIATHEGNADATTYYRRIWDKSGNEEIALKLYRSLSRDAKAADAFLASWVQRQPASSTARLLLGIRKQQAGDVKGAISEYETAIHYNDRDVRALNNLAWLYFEQGDKRALATAEKAYALQPRNPAILDTYGWILVQSQQRDKGIPLLREALKLAPASAEIRDHVKSAETLR